VRLGSENSLYLVSSRRILPAFLAALLVLAGAASAGPRTVAVADVHGAFPEFVATLQTAGLIDDNRRWTGGASVLVQTGDVPDRGAGTRECLDLLMSLEREAGQQKGRVIPLLGNHEVMNMIGDLRYVSPAEYRAFVTPESERTRERAWDDYRGLIRERDRRRRRNPAAETAKERAAWNEQHPLGFFEHRDAYGPRGRYGAWLRTHDAIARVGGVLFVHGGINSQLKFGRVEDLNRRVRDELEEFDQLWEVLVRNQVIWRYMRLEEAIAAAQEEAVEREAGAFPFDARVAKALERLLGLDRWLIMSPEGPLWYRGYAQLADDQLDEIVPALLSRLKAERVVVGHSPTSDHRVRARAGDRIFLIDTGMLAERYGGQGSALEVQDGRVTAYYAAGGREVLVAPKGLPGVAAGGGGKEQ